MKQYQVVENSDIEKFEDIINDLGKDGFCVISHSVAYNSENEKVYSAVLVKYTEIYSSEDHIERILEKLSSIDSKAMGV